MHAGNSYAVTVVISGIVDWILGGIMLSSFSCKTTDKPACTLHPSKMDESGSSLMTSTCAPLYKCKMVLLQMKAKLFWATSRIALQQQA